MRYERLINLCEHVINLPGGLVLPACPKGEGARVAVTRTPVGIRCGVPAFVPVYGEIEGLPEPVDGTVYVVSNLVRGRVPGRIDLASPGLQQRDTEGKVIGADGLDFPE